MSGMGTVINLEGNYYDFTISSNGFEDDAIAIQNDFNMIGQDLNDVIQKIKIGDSILMIAE
jgi:hypothetical protein